MDTEIIIILIALGTLAFFTIGRMLFIWYFKIHELLETLRQIRDRLPELKTTE